MELEIGKTYRNFLGEKVLIVAKAKLNGEGFIGYNYKDEETYQYDADGSFWLSSMTSHDLIEEWTEPESGVFYVNVYPHGLQVADAPRQEDIEDRLACVRVEWVEGQLDQ